MSRNLIIGLFLSLLVTQIAVPVSMIAKREAVLKNGTMFKFKTAPVDPYDAFRGRYVALSVEVNNVIKPTGVNLKHRQRVYAQLAVDKNGFAQVTGISLRKPVDPAYVIAQVNHLGGHNVGLHLPIDRYYMEEKAAPLAEQVYREHSRSDKRDAYVTVKIQDGFAVIEGVYIDRQRIEDVIKLRR